MLIAQITDTHIKVPGKLAYKRVDTAEMLRACVAALLARSQQPDLILHTGDLTDFGLPEEYAHLKAILAPLRARILAIPGNHDEREAMREAFATKVLPRRGLPALRGGRGTAALHRPRYGGAGQGGGELCAERLAWLEPAWASSPTRRRSIMMHHPPFLTGIGHMDAIGLTGEDDSLRS